MILCTLSKKNPKKYIPGDRSVSVSMLVQLCINMSGKTNTMFADYLVFPQFEHNSQRRKITMKKKMFLPLLPGIQPKPPDDMSSFLIKQTSPCITHYSAINRMRQKGIVWFTNKVCHLAWQHPPHCVCVPSDNVGQSATVSICRAPNDMVCTSLMH